jgi:hypothetical protein
MTSNDLLQLKIHADEMQLYLVRESKYDIDLGSCILGGVIRLDPYDQ